MPTTPGMRFALRSLSRTPAFTALAILTLAVGIGTNTAIFAIIDELAFKPSRGAGHTDVYHVSPIQLPDYDTLLANRPADVLAIAAYEQFGGVLQIPGRAERIAGWRVSGGYADVFQVRAQVGRWIRDEDNVGGVDDPRQVVNSAFFPPLLGQLGEDVAVISDRIWREWFNAAPGIVDAGTITINRRPMRIVGVAPAGFGGSIDLWTPFGHRRLLTREELDRTRPKRPVYGWKAPVPEPTQPRVNVLLRKAAGAADAAVAERLNAVMATRPPSIELPASRVRLEKRRGNETLVATGYTILGFAALIFVAACANLGNMLFARATEREGELAVRLSLGATRWGIFNLLFAETLVICASAAAVGLLLAMGALGLFTDAFPALQLGYWKRVTLDLSLDWRTFGYSVGAGATAALVVGAGSLWRSSRVSLLARLAAAGTAVVAKTEGRTIRTMLVSIQVTAAVLLLIATGLVLENTSTRLNRRLLFETGSLASATIELPPEYDPSHGAHFFAELLARVQSIDGVAAAGLTDALPGGESPYPRGGQSAIMAETAERGPSGTPLRLDGSWLHISPEFLSTLGLEVLRGRDFLDTDEAGSDPVALVTESTARRLWPGVDPLGQKLRCCGATFARRVVGLVPDPVGWLDRPATLDLGEAFREQSGNAGRAVFVLLPAAQRYQPRMLVVLRSDRPSAMIQPLRDALVALDAAVPVFDAGPVQTTQFAQAGGERAVRTLASALGAISLGIALFGVYAIVSYFVSRRRREFGLRLALGSTRHQIARLVVDYAIHIVLIGLLPGVLFASLGTRYFQAELRELHPNGLTVWIAVPVLMLVAGIIAAYIPARRAAKVDPYSALRDL